MKQNTIAADEGIKATEQLAEGDSITVEYDSANTDGLKELSGDVMGVSDSFNGKAVLVKIKRESNGKHYRMHVDKESGEATHLELLQYEWQNGERRRVEGTRTLLESYGEGITSITFEAEDDTEVVSIESNDEDTHTVEFVDGFSAVIEPYDDAEGASVAAGEKYVTEQRLREISNRLNMHVERGVC